VTLSLRVLPAAAADIEDAHEWYQARRPGLGDEFLQSVTNTLGTILRQPERYPVVHRDLRRALLRRFPYGIFYKIQGDRVMVVACFHAKRDPRRWQSRS
jgi:plasmid stabilization system protein ParE